MGNHIFTIKGKMLKDALADFKMSVDVLVNDKPLYGQSMWHSLQFVEKIMKEYLKSKNIKFQFSHDLKKLAKLFINLEFNEIDISNVQCNALARYDSDIHNQEECIKSHVSAQKIVYEILKHGYAKILDISAHNKGYTLGHSAFGLRRTSCNPGTLGVIIYWRKYVLQKYKSTM